MLSRSEIKRNARAGVRAAYWPSVGALALILAIFLGLGAIIVSPTVIFVAEIAFAPISVGMYGYFLGIYRRDGATRVGRVFNIAFSQNYGRKLGGMAWMTLWSYIWMLPSFGVLFCAGIYAQFLPDASTRSGSDLLYLFGEMSAVRALFIVLTIACSVIACIKALSYYMTPFILADCPNVTATNALRLSKRMTRGHKGEIFVMMFSFTGWMILTLLSFMILLFFWLGPYNMAAFAGQYDELKRRAIDSGAVAAEEFEGQIPA